MARVGLTQDLKSSIESKVSDLYEPAVKDVLSKYPVIIEQAYKIALDSHGVTRSQLEAVPKEFMRYSKEMWFRWISDEENKTQRKECIHFPEDRPVAHTWTDSYNCKLMINDPSITTPLREWYQKRKDAENAKINAVRSIRSVMDQCTTLNQLLKLVPDIKNVVPQWALTKVDEKVERKTAEKVEVDAAAIEDLSNSLAVGILAGIV